MKRRDSILGVVIIALMLVGGAGYAYQNDEFNDDYKISQKEALSSASGFDQSWEITYGESGRPVEVLLKEGKSGNEYIVRTGYFEVKYVNGDKGFGVRSLKPAEQKVPADLNAKVLDAAGMESQRVISPQRLEDAQVLDLIAAYLPELLRGDYRSILN